MSEKFRPKDQQWLQEICELVKNKMPDSHTFVVFAFPVHGTDRMYYASNATRESAVAALKQWLANVDTEPGDWMKHDASDPKALFESLCAAYDLAKIKWGNLDPDAWKLLEAARAVIDKHKPMFS